ncbi:ubiquinol-cytochrome c reductase iron-sulfur subunit [Deinococcus cavernae]|uniref:Ubiquinol-cytochrome c reductase iron-sulfur subunit n=1 Tax=Deinococcus cavernae TaxID=2320857 RepID=A0A418V7L4_9DEIO|nr:ubiquinol-cytochrome c reductase iron-sulfur subunit [Deinococcus cavernae]RJF72066.1 ubiquinol-cytochrome c reductase iron-sulfur subunit [Deinococcus cavernae]
MTRYKKNDPEITRRKFINTAVGASAAVGGLALVSTLGGANPVFRLTRDKMPPVPGDVLIHAEGAKSGQPVTAADLSEKLTRAWPQGKDKEGNPLVRNGDPNNILAVYKFPPGQLVAPTNLESTIDGQIVAYSDICTHAGCSVSDDDQKAGQMKCPCHSGQYDPKQGCKVVGGPPPRALAQLPLKMDADKIVVGDYFLTMPYPFLHEEEWEARKKAVEDALS